MVTPFRDKTRGSYCSKDRGICLQGPSFKLRERQELCERQVDLLNAGVRGTRNACIPVKIPADALCSCS